MDAFIGEVRPFAFGWLPDGWLACNGASYPVIQYQALWSVISNVYGGTPNQTFNVPNLQGEAIVGVAQGQGLNTSPYTLGQTGGVEKVTLNVNQIPNHDHNLNGATGATGFRTAVAGNTSYLTNFGYGGASATTFTSASGYINPGTPDTMLNPLSVTQTGSGGAHENMQPYLAVTYGICWDGYYPTRP